MAGRRGNAPFIIYDPGANNQTINNLIEVSPTGVIFAFFTEILNLPNGRVRVNIAFKRSLDHGFSFLPTSGRTIAHRIFTLAIDNPFGTFTPDLRRAGAGCQHPLRFGDRSQTPERSTWPGRTAASAAA